MNRRPQRYVKNLVKDRPTPRNSLNSLNSFDLEEWMNEQLAKWPNVSGNDTSSPPDLVFQFEWETYQVVAISAHFSFFNWRIEL